MPVAGRVHYLEAIPPSTTATGRARAGTLVLLHAFPLNARMWESQLALSAHGWHVIAPQLRGVDGSYDERPVQSIDDYAGDLIDLLDGLHVDEAVVCGQSLGGYLAFALLRHAPSYVRGLILADTRPQADTPEGLEARRKMLALVRQKGAAAVADEMIPKLLGETTRTSRPAIVERVRALITASSPESIENAVHALMSRPDSTSLLLSIHVPTLIIVGEEDAITPPSISEDMHVRIAGSELVRIPLAGHLSNLERPDAFNAAVATFLDHRV